jgi:hypothetical protein
MSITIDTETLHKWALDNGYVRLSDISAWVKMHGYVDPDDAPPLTQAQLERATFVSRAPVEVALSAMRAVGREALHPGAFTAEIATLEQPDDLKPVDPFPTLKEVTDALRAVIGSRQVRDEGVVAGQNLLAEFCITKISDLPAEKRREFLALAELHKVYQSS